MLHFLSSKLFKLARSRISGLFIGFSFAYLSRFLPVKRLAESSKAIAFAHPSPSYPFHGLVVPKLIKPTFLDLKFNDETDQAALIEVLKLCQQVGRQHHLVKFSIIVNGGIYQDVPQVHFHIARIKEDTEEEVEVVEGVGGSKVVCYRPASSKWAFHLLLEHSHLQTGFIETNFGRPEVKRMMLELFEAAQAILKKEKPAGFSVMINVQQGSNQTIRLEIVSNHVRPTV